MQSPDLSGLSAGGLSPDASGSGPPLFHPIVAQSLERAAWAREAAGGNPASRTNLNAAVAESSRHPSSKRIDAGESPASSASILPDGVKVARRFVKPLVLVQVQVWQPINLNERNPMRPVITYRSQLLFRRSYKPGRVRLVKAAPPGRLVFKPSRGFGSKPQFSFVP